MSFGGKDHYSPNHVLIVTTIALVCASFLCARSLWIPASRIQNLHFRAVVLSITEVVSSYAASTGLDTFVPRVHESFLDVTGLAEHSSWDTRYFNRRESAARAASIVPPETATVSKPVPETISVTEPDKSVVLTPDALSDNPDETSPEAVSGKGIKRFSVFSRENPLPVYFFGDSQVFSLASGLSRLAGRDSALDIDFLAIHSSGFIRDDFYDWPQKLGDTLAEKDYAAVVVMLGMNDYQNFWADNRRALKKRTENWETVYREKCRVIIDTALSRAMRVYWVGMPRVKNPSYNDNLVYIDKIHDSVAEEYSPDVLVRIPLRDVVPGPDQPYTDSIELAPGKLLRVMTDDGAHYTVEGGQLVMKGLFDRLVRDFPFSELPVAHLPE